MVKKITRSQLKQAIIKAKRNVLRRRMGRSMALSAPSYIHYFKRTFAIPAVQWVRSSDGVAAGISDNGQFMAYWNMNFTLSQLPNPTDFTNLYDSYQVLGIKVKFIPYHNIGENAITSTGASAGTGATIGAVPYLTYAIDRDGSTATTPGQAFSWNQNALLQYANCRTVRLDKPHSVYIKAPGYYDQNAAQSTSVEVNYSKKNKWIDCNHTGVIFNGLNTAISYPYMWSTSGVDNGTPVAYPNKIQVLITYYLRCKNAR